MSVKKHRVIGNRALNYNTYVLRLERNEFDFEPGQYIHVGPLPGNKRREYTIYSSQEDDYLEILIKEIPKGTVSPYLKRLSINDTVEVEGPYGFFKLEGNDNDRHLFVATGTGISPYHCFVQSHPGLKYTLVHGIRTNDDFYEHEHFSKNNLIRCVSRENTGDFQGHVTGWMHEKQLNLYTYIYLCGGCNMIYAAYEILGQQGIPVDRVQTEIFF